ncbi:MAG: hypothetical protein ACYC42_08805, partial [Lysobacter sp.]
LRRLGCHAQRLVTAPQTGAGLGSPAYVLESSLWPHALERMLLNHLLANTIPLQRNVSPR